MGDDSTAFLLWAGGGEIPKIAKLTDNLTELAEEPGSIEYGADNPGAQDHHSMIEYHGKWYYFYHTGNYGSGGSLYQCKICVDSMFYDADGRIREIIVTQTGVRP